jgi:AcrR family transcriptional regulator
MAPPTRPPSNRAIQAEQTRQQILDTAERLFAESGYDATSIQMIADELGLTKAAVYYHFRAKNDILNAVMLPGQQRVATLLDEAAALRGRRARIDHVVTGWVDFLVHKRHIMSPSTDPATKRLGSDTVTETLNQRALTLFYGEQPTPAERLSYRAAFSLMESLPDMADLSDDDTREVLRTTMLRILRTPS